MGIRLSRPLAKIRNAFRLFSSEQIKLDGEANEKATIAEVNANIQIIEAARRAAEVIRNGRNH